MNDFVLLDQIGQGAFGRVFKAQRKSTKDMFAAKVTTLLTVGANFLRQFFLRQITFFA